MLEASSDIEKFIPLAVLGLMFAIYLRFAGIRQKDREALAEHLGLGQRDELPSDFPTSSLDRFGKWEVLDILSGIQGDDQILTFDVQTGARNFNTRRSTFVQTVVARRTDSTKPFPIPTNGIYYQQVGQWRIAMKHHFLLSTFQRLRAKDIERLWTLLA